jgi:hypothetical protein
VQLGTARFLGTFLPDPEQSPAVVVEYIAEQLGLDPADIRGYGTRETRWNQQQQIRREYGYADFGGWEWFALARWLYVRCRIGNDRPVVLFDRATARLVEAKILPPGVSTLERLVASIRERAESRLWQNLAAVPDDEREHLRTCQREPQRAAQCQVISQRPRQPAPGQLLLRGAHRGLLPLSDPAVRDRHRRG